LCGLIMAIIYFMHAPNFGCAMQYANVVPETGNAPK
jgi:hypothetical protein